MKGKFEVEQNGEYMRLLKEIAHSQSILFSKHYNWKTKEIRQRKSSRGFRLGKTSEEKEYDQCRQDLERLKDKIKNLCRTEANAQEWQWWNSPWEEVEAYLLNDLLQESVKGNWRYEYHWEAIGNDMQKILILREEGHYTDFSSREYEYQGKESRYSEEQQEQMVENFNMELDKHRKKDIWQDDGRAVKTDRGNVYDSITDYYNSWEYQTGRSIASNFYERSLYTKCTTNIKTVVSSSRHYECLFEVGAFHIDRNKELDGLIWHPFELKACRGDIPENLEYKYAASDAAVACAAFVHDQDSIESVSDELFEKLSMYRTNSGAEAAKISKIITCLADKL